MLTQVLSLTKKGCIIFYCIVSVDFPVEDCEFILHPRKSVF